MASFYVNITTLNLRCTPISPSPNYMPMKSCAWFWMYWGQAEVKNKWPHITCIRKRHCYPQPWTQQARNIIFFHLQQYQCFQLKDTNAIYKMKYLGLFTLNGLLRLKFLLRLGATAAFLAASVASGKWFPWKFDLFRARAPCQKIKTKIIEGVIFQGFPLPQTKLRFIKKLYLYIKDKK